MIANPAAAGEGISLHKICHDAIYLDRSYNTTHYLQSIDRIHRLGFAPGVETYIHIFQTVAPQGIGSIDGSVNRRLAAKLRNLQQLLNDPDLHELALDEEDAVDPTNYGMNSPTLSISSKNLKEKLWTLATTTRKNGDTPPTRISVHHERP